MDLAEQVARERRARLAAERLCALKEAELSAANAMLSQHARLLSGQIIETRDNIKVIRQQAAQLQNENSTVRSDLERAESAAELAERRLWTSIQAIREGFAVFDAGGTLVHANRAFRGGFDWIAAAEPGVSVTALIRLAVDEGIVDHGSRAATRWVEEMEALWAGGSTEPRTIKLWNGQFVRLILRHAAGGDRVLIVQNITRTIRRVAVLREARWRAEAASRAKSSFLANMSHEIRTPMNGVVGMADLLGETALSDDQKVYVDAIRGSGEALLTIINDVLDYSKIEAKRLALTPEPFDLELAIREVARMVQPAIRDKGVDLVIDYDETLPRCFRGDPGRIRQVLVNLVGNAAKFTEKGRIAVRVAGLPADDPGLNRHLHVTVEDTGIGIAPEAIVGIWGEFNQVENGRNRLFGGTGLGLAITRQLVELMGGRIWVDSAPGKGSCFGFQVTLPVAAEVEADSLAARAVVVERQPEDRTLPTQTPECSPAVHSAPETEGPTPEERARLEPAQPASAPCADEPRPMRVLVAEDNATNRLLIDRMLKNLPLAITFVEDGVEAIEAFERVRPEIVLTDISMPRMDGKEASRHIRGMEVANGWPRTPIVAVTAHALVGDAEDILAAGIDGYMTKPVRKAELLGHIRNAATDRHLPLEPQAAA